MPPMKIKPKAFVLALLPVPILMGFAFLTLDGGDGTLTKFAFGFIFAALVQTPAALFIFLPALMLLEKLTPPTGPKVWLLGAFCGLIAYFPMSYLAYTSSGADSGPPEGTYLEFLLGWGLDPVIGLSAAAGLVTAAFYHRLAGPPPRV